MAVTGEHNRQTGEIRIEKCDPNQSRPPDRTDILDVNDLGSGGPGRPGPPGKSGASGNSGSSGSSGSSGLSGASGASGRAGPFGLSGLSGASGLSGFSGLSGASAASGLSGFSSQSGQSGRSGFSGSSGQVGPSGTSGRSGASGISGKSGKSGTSGFSGFSGVGISGPSGPSGPSGSSGFSGFSGTFSGASGFSGKKGSSGPSGPSGPSGFSGQSGFSGPTGTGIVEAQVELVYANKTLAPPTIVKLGRLDALSFAPSVTNALDFSFEIPSDLVVSNDVQVNVVYHMSTAGTGDVNLQMIYDVVTLGGDTTPPGITGTASIIIPAPGTAETKNEVDLTIPASDIPGTTSSIRFTLKRDGGSVTDTFAASFVVESVSIRYTGFGAPVDNSGFSGFSGLSGFSGATPGLSGFSGFSGIGFVAVPATSTSTAISGQMAFESLVGFSGFLYVAIGTNRWARTLLDVF